MNAFHKISKILRIKTEDLFKIDSQMQNFTINDNVIENLVVKNDERIDLFLNKIKLDRTATAEEISHRISSILTRSEDRLFKFFGKPDFSKRETLAKFDNSVKNLVSQRTGHFIKQDIARRMLINTPPPNLLRYLGYSSIKRLLEKENIYEIYALLRVVEDRNWMNMEFIKNYKSLTPLDFEERQIEILVLQDKWRDLFRDFVEKKYHDLSHLKELGVIFILPINSDSSGFWLRVFGLLIHYIYEIEFYSDLFKHYFSKDDFAERFQSALRGDIVSVEDLPKIELMDKPAIFIIQRYLAKDDQSDPRLYLPHINPETFHWKNAENLITRFSEQEGIEGLNLHYFKDCDFVGDFFQSEKVGELLVSFDLVDNIMALVKEEEMIKYLYHQQEALWTAIFREYLGEKKLRAMLLENFEKGYILLE